MATRGRKPKPTAMKILEGNPGKRPLNENEPVPPKGEIKSPAWLLPEAKKEWKRLAPSLEAMGVLTMADWTAFQGYCQAYARWKEADYQEDILWIRLDNTGQTQRSVSGRLPFS